MVLIAVLAGGWALRKAWKFLTYASTIHVANGQVEVRRGPFFRDSTPFRIPCDAVADTQVQYESSSNDQDFYSLSMVMKKGNAKTTLLLAEMLPNREEARWMADHIHQAAKQEAAST